MITKRAQIAVETEAEEGTAETLEGADALLVSNPKFKSSDDVTARNNVSASLSPFSSVVGKRSAIIEFDVELKGSGAAGTRYDSAGSRHGRER